MELHQKGENSKFPQRIYTWQKGEPIPEWLSDQARVNGMEENTGKVTIETRPTSSGGYEILGSDGVSVIARTKGDEDYICCDLENLSRVIVLNKLQLSLLYE